MPDTGAADARPPAATQPFLTVVVPAYDAAPEPLLAELAAARARLDDPMSVAILVLDDGAPDPRVARAIAACVARLAPPVGLIADGFNRGRAGARNRLAQAARGAYVLFLDADMRLPDPEFLGRWIAHARDCAPAVSFGGFVACAADGRSLHAALARLGDCPDAVARARAPARHTATSNLLVRTDIARDLPFDESFVGWGWEDVEWATRVAAAHPITHVDIPADHGGLHGDGELLSRFAASAQNFARFAAAHPEAARSMPIYQAALAFARAPALHALRPLFAALARDGRALLPLRVRVGALKLWRASWYGAAL